MRVATLTISYLRALMDCRFDKSKFKRKILNIDGIYIPFIRRYRSDWALGIEDHEGAILQSLGSLRSLWREVSERDQSVHITTY